MKKFLFSIAMICCSLFLGAGNYSVKNLELDKANGIYKTGEEVVVSGLLLEGGKNVTTGKVRALIHWENKKIAEQEVACDGTPFRFTYKGTKPGWVYFAIQRIDADGKVVQNPLRRPLQSRKKTLVAEIGAVFSPEDIRSTVAEPDDFDAFWKKRRETLNKIPFNAKLEKCDPGTPGIELYSMVLDTGVDNPVTGYIAYPSGAKPGSLPAYATFLSWSWCDVRPTAAIAMAKNGMIAVAASWHGLPLKQPQSFYTDYSKTFKSLGKMYIPDKWTMGYMYIRVLRALDFLKSRPEWNKKDLIVKGGSLAGAETAAAAALDPDVTLAFIHTPCFAELNADLDNRCRSIPTEANHPSYRNPLARKTFGYHDLVNLAKRIKCEVYFCTGFADQVCPPSNIYAAYNNVPAGVKKVICTNPGTGHYGTTRDVDGEARLAEFIKNRK